MTDQTEMTTGESVLDAGSRDFKIATPVVNPIQDSVKTKGENRKSRYAITNKSDGFVAVRLNSGEFLERRITGKTR